MASPRRLVMETLKEKAKEVRNGAYFVKRGVINWAAFDFESHPRAIAILADEIPMFGRGDGGGFKDAQFSMEVFTKLPSTDDPPEIDDGLLDELIDDVHWIIMEMMAAKDSREFPVVFNVVKSRIKLVESHDTSLGVQGIVVFLPVSY